MTTTCPSRVYTTPSRSKPGTVHTIRWTLVENEVVWECTCPSWYFRKTCAHIDQALILFRFGLAGGTPDHPFHLEMPHEPTD